MRDYPMASVGQWPDRKSDRWWRLIKDCRSWIDGKCTAKELGNQPWVVCGPDCKFCCSKFQCEQTIPGTKRSIDDYLPSGEIKGYDEEWGYWMEAIQSGRYFRIEQGLYPRSQEIILSRGELMSLRDSIGEAIRDTQLRLGKELKKEREKKERERKEGVQAHVS